MPERSPFGKLARGFAVAGTLGFGFAAVVGAAIWLGYRLDRALGWRPLGLTLLFGVLGGAAGIAFIVQTLRAFESRGGPERESASREDREDP